jgi:hypothetical protein
MMSSLALLVTAWTVSDNPPGSETGWLPAAFVVFGLSGGVLRSALDVQEGDSQPAIYVLRSLLGLLPFALVVWGATAWMEGSAYAYLIAWCWWTLAACGGLLVAGALVRCWRAYA